MVFICILSISLGLRLVELEDFYGMSNLILYLSS